MKYIEICGNIASGKTTLASRICIDDWSKIYEDFKNNPFYDIFYQNPLKYSFETEVTFLLQHYNAIKAQIQSKDLICDYSLLLDMVYADVNLTGNRHRIFFEIVEEIQQELGLPQNIIYLTCPENILLERIRARSREAEVTITLDYLKNLSKALHSRVDTISSQTRVITINSGQVDFRTSIDGIPELRSL